jgi:hypothetical protein
VPTVAEAKTRLEGLEGHVAMALWVREDVIGKAKAMGYTLTNEAADDILDEIDRKQDAELGISWTTLECYIEDYQKKEES